MNVYSTCENYLDQIIKYFGHLPECEEMYRKIKFLYDNFDTYNQLYEDKNNRDDKFLEDIFKIFKILDSPYKEFTDKDDMNWIYDMELKWQEQKDFNRDRKNEEDE